MQTWIALLRAVNVGGKNLLPMAELRAMAAAQGWREAKTHIQSGNLVFRAEGAPEVLAEALGQSVLRAKGFRPPILVMDLARLAAAVAANPFSGPDMEANRVHLHFGLGPGMQLDESAAARLALPQERLHLAGSVLYLHAPDGVGRSKLFAKLPQLLSQEVTVRNLKTARAVYDLAAAL